MDAQEIQAFLRQHWELFQMGIRVLCLIGAMRDWDWLCGAAGTRQAGSPFGRTGRRFFFGACGMVLLLTGLWMAVS